MNRSTVMAYVDDEPDADRRLNCVFDMVAGLDAVVLGVSVSEAEPPLPDGWGFGAMAGEALGLRRDMAETELATARSRFQYACDVHANTRVEWRAEVGFPTAWVARQARQADLIVVGRDAGRSPYRAPSPGDLLMSSGRPVLIAPPDPERAPVGGRVMVAWRDGREAQRAVQAALPLLRRAETVHVVELSEADQVEAARSRLADVAAWLSRHGVAVETEVRVEDDRPTGKRLLVWAGELGAELIVCGAWGHPRVREWVMGGVTRTLLAESPTWLLMSH